MRRPRPPPPPPLFIADEEKKLSSNITANTSSSTTTNNNNSILFDAKLQVLIHNLISLQQDDPTVKCLVFTQFQSTLIWLEDELHSYGIATLKITGDMSMTKRKKILEQFDRSNRAMVFLLSVRTGAVGLTLTAASHVFLLEPCLNPALTEQAINRVHRLGQQREVYITHLIMRHSVEEQIDKVNRDKMKQLQQQPRDNPGIDMPSVVDVANNIPAAAAALNVGSMRRDAAAYRMQELQTLFEQS